MIKSLLISIILVQISWQMKYIPYQAHGFNDMNYFAQLLVKGVDFFKMDLSPQIRDTCIRESTWTPELNDCETFSNNFQICCLAFRGDTSSIPIFQQPFNHSMELIDLLKNPRYYHILKKGAEYPYQNVKKIAINFQYNDPLAMITQGFIYNLLKVIQQYDLNIELFTGTDRFVEAYIKKCQGECTYVEKFIADSPIYLQSGSENPVEFYGQQRYQNFNVFYHSILNYCESGFPHWIEQYGWPIVFWEPSHEYQIQFTREKWEDKDCKIRDSLKNVQNLRIASNLEPEMVQVYWKQPVFELNNQFNPDDQKLIVYGEYENPSIEYCEYCDSLIFSLNSGNEAILQIYDKEFNKLNQVILDYNVDYVRSYGEYVLVQGENNATLFLLYKDSQQQCSIKQIDQYDMIQSEMVSISYNTKEIIFLNLNYEMDSIDLKFQSLNDNSINQVVSYQMQSIMKTPIMHLSFDAYYQNNSQSYHIALSFSKMGMMYGEQGFQFRCFNLFIFQVKQNSQVKIYLNLLQLDNNYQIIENVLPLHHIDFGSTSELKLYEINGEMHVLAIHTNGLCQSAILLNNNEWNKCIYEDFTEYSSISNVQNTINYFWGSLDNVKKRVETGQKINGCDLQIMHAKLANGKEPSITLRVHDDQFEAFVLTGFVHYKEQTAFTQLFCGSSNDYKSHKDDTDGAVLFSFDLVNPKQLSLIDQ